MNEHCCVIVLLFVAPCFATGPRCEVQYQEFKGVGYNYRFESGRLATDNKSCQKSCNDYVDCIAACWGSRGGLCYWSSNKTAQGKATDRCVVYEPQRICDEGCSWVEKRQQEGGYIGNLVSIHMSLAECKDTCHIKPSCEAISWKEGEACYLHPPNNGSFQTTGWTYIEFGAECQPTTNENDHNTEADTSTRGRSIIAKPILTTVADASTKVLSSTNAMTTDNDPNTGADTSTQRRSTSSFSNGSTATRKAKITSGSTPHIKPTVPQEEEPKIHLFFFWGVIVVTALILLLISIAYSKRVALRHLRSSRIRIREMDSVEMMEVQEQIGHLEGINELAEEDAVKQKTNHSEMHSKKKSKKSVKKQQEALRSKVTSAKGKKGATAFSVAATSGTSKSRFGEAHISTFKTGVSSNKTLKSRQIASLTSSKKTRGSKGTNPHSIAPASRNISKRKSTLIKKAKVLKKQTQ